MHCSPHLLSLPSARECVGMYLDLLRKFRYVLLSFWVVLLGVCIYGATHIYDKIDNNLPAPPNSGSALAGRALVRLYGEEQEFAPEVLLVELPAHTGGDFFTNGLIKEVVGVVEEYWKNSPEVEIESYLSAQVLPGVSAFFMSESNRSSIITVLFPVTWTIDSVYRQEQDVLHMLGQRFGAVDLVAHFSGPRAFIKEAPALLEHDLLIIHVFVIPLAFAALAIAFKSWRLLLLPLCTLILSLSVCATCVYFISLLMKTDSASPIMMAAIVLALSIDYSLILLTRFREEIIIRKKGVREACIDMLYFSGMIIVSSGGILFSCFVWILLVPIFRALALVFMVSVLCSLSLNLMIIPTLIITFPNFFTNFTNCPSHCCDKRSGSRVGKCFHFDPPLWFRWGRLVTNRWAFIPSLIGVLMLAALFGWSSSHLRLTGDVKQFDPRGSSLERVGNAIARSFPEGITAPYMLAFESTSAATVLSEPYWSVSREICESIATQLLARQKHGALIGPLYSKITGEDPISLSLPMVKELLKPSCSLPTCRALQLAFNKSANTQRTALLSTLISEQRPSSAEASHFLGQLRDLVAKENEKHGGVVKVWIAGLSVTVADLNAAVVESIPQFTGASAATCLLLIGVTYRSVMIPLRSIVTIALTLIVAFGMLVGCQQMGWFRFLNIEAISPAVSTDISYTVATLGFSVILGLALDYKIFLLGRVVEEHDNGLSDQAAVHVGVWKTGPVITMAGVIMTIAFCGLLFASMPLINQAGVLLVTAVLFDTCIMRTMVTPALLRVIGRLNWWPRRSPQVTCNDARSILDREGSINSEQSECNPKNSP